MPLDFVYDKVTNQYRLEDFESDEQLLEQVRSGIGDPEIYQGIKFIYIDGIFGATTPEDVY